jgi:hypothetical protein
LKLQEQTLSEKIFFVSVTKEGKLIFVHKLCRNLVKIKEGNRKIFFKCCPAGPILEITPNTWSQIKQRLKNLSVNQELFIHQSLFITNSYGLSERIQSLPVIVFKRVAF